MSRLWVGGLLAFALLTLYLYALGAALVIAHSCTSQCTLPEGIAALLQTVGALVSAVVVSELAVTKPTEEPGTRIAAEVTDGRQKRAVKFLAEAYITAWVVSGLVLVIVGWIQSPTEPQVTGAAKEWLGFAIAAAYAYFGISAQ